MIRLIQIIMILFVISLPFLAYLLFKWLIKRFDPPKKETHKSFRPREFETHSEYQDYLNDIKKFS